MSDRKYRIDLEPSGNRWEWTVWGWGREYDRPDSEKWRPPHVAFSMDLPLSCRERDFEGRAKSLYSAELAARRFIALIETWFSAAARKEQQSISIEVAA